MRDRNISDVLVLDSDGGVEGVITDQDVVIGALTSDRDPQTVHLYDIVGEDRVTVTADQPAADAVQLMRDHAKPGLPVTDNGRVVGVVTLDDLADVHVARRALSTSRRGGDRAGAGTRRRAEVARWRR